MWTLPEFQQYCCLNANAGGNLVCEVTGHDLGVGNWEIDRVINGIVVGRSGEYGHAQCLIVHQKINDMKEAGGCKIFASCETLELEKQHRGNIEADNCIATQIILWLHLHSICTFRASPEIASISVSGSNAVADAVLDTSEQLLTLMPDFVCQDGLAACDAVMQFLRMMLPSTVVVNTNSGEKVLKRLDEFEDAVVHVCPSSDFAYKMA
ncbi:hypothetical protein CcCBS67573_g05492 [Chytriomyces confervae]|uniref:Uncharacterized protein n=1 Tax=Chytriomyces confervae TaxID=246404 RepID=A0A507FA79_9FUNG|nr:hypothetical protein CcCBS67573_g05492 [Chytriomyces confervae]